LFLSKLDEQDIREAFAPCDISEIAAEVIDSLSFTLEKQGVKIDFTSTPCIVSCNKLLIYEMLLNLIHNAIQYNIPDGNIRVIIKESDRRCFITISDTGIGIPKDEQARVFERFYRVEQSRGRKTGGAGLGLSIVNHIVRYHKGSINLTSEPGEGTQVDVQLHLR